MLNQEKCKETQKYDEFVGQNGGLIVFHRALGRSQTKRGST